MSAPVVKAPDSATLLAMVRLARRVLDVVAAERGVPPEVKTALSRFYDLTDYHGIAPGDAPHIPDDKQI